MRNIRYFVTATFGLVIFSAPLAYAGAQSISVQAISPAAAIFADSKITFIIVSSGFVPGAYQVSDSFPDSTASVSDINGGGDFSWVPVESDVGTHVLSVGATDSSGDAANTTVTITVEPAPSVLVSAVSSSHIMPGTKFTFSVSSLGFTDPSYIVSDSFDSSTVIESDLDASDNFSWTPVDIGQDGQHTINVYAYDSLGHTASVNVPVLVGSGPTLVIQSLAPGASVSPSQSVSFSVSGSNFSPDTFSVSDNFPNTTITNADINTSGSFDWNPQESDIGTHVLTITGTIGIYGQSATTTQTITVLGSAAAPAVAAPATIAAGGFTFTASLYSGMQGEQVTELQTILSKLGLFSATPNGEFGPLTTAAVKQFQAAHNLPQLGVVGPATRAALNSVSAGSSASANTPAISSVAASTTGYTFESSVSFGQSGVDVLALQKRLAALGFFSAQPSGYFGDATLEALIQFQKAKNIPMVDQLGDATRAALNQ